MLSNAVYDIELGEVNHGDAILWDVTCISSRCNESEMDSCPFMSTRPRRIINVTRILNFKDVKRKFKKLLVPILIDFYKKGLNLFRNSAPLIFESSIMSTF